jgi:outer membrane protein assembly complex protein YaeT
MKAPCLALATLMLTWACRSTGEALPEVVTAFPLRFEGNETLASEELDGRARSELARLGVVVLDRAALDDVAFALELAYQELGYPEVAIGYELDEGSSGALFRIDEGPLVRVRELLIEGAAALEPARVRARLKRFDAGRPFDREGLVRAVDALRELYLARGHQRLVLPEPELAFHEDDTVSITLRIDEGPAFHVTRVSFTGGAPELSALERDRADELLLEHEDSHYDPGFERALEARLVEDYRRRGYPDAEIAITPVLEQASGEVELACAVRPGPRVTLDDIRITGNVRTRTEAVHSALGLEIGMVYDSEELRRAFRDLYALGLFDSVEIVLEGAGERRALVVTLHETRSVEIRIEPGWGSYEGPRLLTGISENNFRGMGELVVLEGTISLRARSARVAWIDRDFLGTRMISEATLGVEQREEPSYEFVRQTFGYFLRQPLGPDWQASLGYEFRPTNLVDESLLGIAPDIIEDTEVGALSVGLALEDRDNPLLPTRGRHGRARLEVAEDGVGSDTEFVRAHFEYAHLFRLGNDDVLAAALRTGVMQPYGISDDVPITERFFNGGENSVRSFREDELGPKDVSGEPIGGEAATTLNLEYRRLLSGNLAAALFADTGNVALEATDYLRFDDFRSALGAGLAYLLPIGPVRLDFGWNPSARADEDDWVVHVSVGFAF